MTARAGHAGQASDQGTGQARPGGVQPPGEVTKRRAAGSRRAAGGPRRPGQPDRESTTLNWQDTLNRLAPLRRRWDLAVLANLADGAERPRDLIGAINEQAADDAQIGWKVLNDTLRRLEKGGYVARQEIPNVPRETRYRLRPRGRDLIRAVGLLGSWYDGREPGDGHGTRSGKPAPGEDAGGTSPPPGRPEPGFLDGDRDQPGAPRALLLLSRTGGRRAL